MKQIMLYCIFLGTAAFLPVRGKESGPTPAFSAFAAGHNHFAFRLLDAVLQQENYKKNVAISPLSVYLSLGMLYNAADHETRDSIAEALGTTDFGSANLNALCRDLVREMSQQDERSELILANSIWYNRKKGPIQPAFENTCESYFYSPVHATNFNSRLLTGQINRWVDQSTRHRVQNIVPAVNPKDQLYLVNATCFRSDWTSPFDPGDTKEDVFFLPGGRARATLFMKKEMAARTYSDTSFTMVGLPYGNGSAYSLYIVLPDDPDQSMRDFMSSFSTSKLYDAVSRMNDRWVELYLPRWEYSYVPEDMSAVFRKMGMGILLNDYGNADLSNLCKTAPNRLNISDLLAGRSGSQRFCLSKAFYKTSVAVNEKGMQTGFAPAVTAAHDSSMPVRRHHAQVIRADRPFFYAVISRQQQAILLAGIVNDPGKDH